MININDIISYKYEVVDDSDYPKLHIALTEVWTDKGKASEDEVLYLNEYQLPDFMDKFQNVISDDYESDMIERSMHE